MYDIRLRAATRPTSMQIFAEYSQKIKSECRLKAGSRSHSDLIDANIHIFSVIAALSTVFFSSIKTWAGLCRKFVMGMHCGSGIIRFKTQHQPPQRLALCLSPGIGRRFSVSRNTTHIGYSDAVTVISETMRTYHLYLASFMHSSVKPHHIMITDAFESPRPMPAVKLLQAHLAPFRCRRAVHNDFPYLSHSCRLRSF